MFWSVSTSSKRQPLKEHELAFLDHLMVHLKRVVLAQRHIYEFSLNNLVGYNLIDQLPQAICLLNLAGKVVHYNQKMGRLMAVNPLIQLEDQSLKLPYLYQQRLLDIFYQIEHAFRYHQEKLIQFKNTRFSIFDHEQSLAFKINLLVSEKEMSFFGIRPLIMLTFDELIDLNLSRSINGKTIYYLCHESLRHRYKLSYRELQVCDLFLNGANLDQIAQTMSLTLNSVRTYLKHIFVKTQCNSQVELMQFLMRHHYID